MMKDDFYWIDPNLGMVDDAVKVYCNMSAGGETCVFPDVHTSRMPNIPWRKSREGWYSTLRGGFKVTYDSLGPVQLTFLRLMSVEAYQLHLHMHQLGSLVRQPPGKLQERDQTA